MLAPLDAVALGSWLEGRRHLPRVLKSAAVNGPEAWPLEGVLESLGAGGAVDHLAAALRERALRSLDAASRAAMLAIPWGDARFPPLLAAIHDPPAVMWLKGSDACLARPTVAIVGSRVASAYGLEIGTRLAADLAAAGATVVSGLARGVDSAAHRGALQGGGPTVGVLGSGLDIIYPPEHCALAESMVGCGGALVSDYPPGTPPRPLHFPARNRIISGLSLAVVVVEAAEKSGSLITAHFALDQGREVLAVPGSVLSGRHGGCHALIRDGAALVDSADDVCREIGASTLLPVTPPGRTESTPPHPVLDRMSAGEAYDLDALARETGLPPAVLLSRLLELELQGAVRRAGGGRFIRLTRTC